jgi:hypothetical protein
MEQTFVLILHWSSCFCLIMIHYKAVYHTVVIYFRIWTRRIRKHDADQQPEKIVI